MALERRAPKFLKNVFLKVIFGATTAYCSSLFDDFSDEVWLFVEFRLLSVVGFSGLESPSDSKTRWFALCRAVWQPSRAPMSISFSKMRLLFCADDFVCRPAFEALSRGFYIFLTAKKHSNEFKFTHCPTFGSLLTQLLRVLRSTVIKFGCFSSDEEEELPLELLLVPSSASSDFCYGLF